MFKKFIGILLVLVLALSLVACGEKGDKPAEDSAPASSDAAPAAKPGDVNGDGKIVVGYISKNLTDPFHAPINAYAETTIEQMKKDGIIDDWTGVLDGETDPNKQIDRADECITKGADYVIILPAESEASDPAVTKLVDQIGRAHV